MGFIKSFDLSLISLLFISALPLLYFIYHGRFWYRPDVTRNLDVLIGLTAGIAGILLLFKMATSGRNAGSPFFQLAMLHLMPIAVTFLTIRNGRHVAAARATRRANSNAAPGDQYTPVPLNSAVETIGWDELVIDGNLREELITVIKLLRDSKTAKKYGIQVPKGILLNGPPGTGKTTIAKVIANTAGMSFFVLKIDEVISKWVGESEKNLARLFQAATAHAPAVIFIDEIDAIGKNRSGQYQWADNLVNQLLQLIDGVVKTEGLYVVAATNRADLVDEALKRSGRLNRVIEVPLPHFEARRQLFSLYLSRLKLSETVSLDQLAALTEGRSGADIKEICNQAGLNAFKRESSGKRRDYLVLNTDLEIALAPYVTVSATA